MTLASLSVVVSSLVIVTAALLAAHQWHQRRDRGGTLSGLDASYFSRQDVRRGMGVVVMVLLALGLAFGARLNARVGGRANPVFVQVWLGVFILIFTLLCLALFDWVSTFLYARRQRRTMARERVELLRQLLRHTPAAEDNGRET